MSLHLPYFLLSYLVAPESEDHKPSSHVTTLWYNLDILCSLAIDVISDSFVKIVAGPGIFP